MRGNLEEKLANLEKVLAVRTSYGSYTMPTLPDDRIPRSFTALKTSGKDAYQGYFDSRGKMNGPGIKVELNGGYILQGSFLDSKLSGNGLVVKPSGNWYVGDWLDNQMHGFGTNFNKSTGARYEGEFVLNAREGRGT